jgi:hypothetical protein
MNIADLELQAGADWAMIQDYARALKEYKGKCQLAINLIQSLDMQLKGLEGYVDGWEGDKIGFMRKDIEDYLMREYANGSL